MHHWKCLGKTTSKTTESSLDQMLPGGCDAGVEQGDWWGRPCAPPPPPPAAAPALVTYSSSRSDTHTNTTSSSSTSLGNHLAYFSSKKHIFCPGKYFRGIPDRCEHLGTSGGGVAKCLQGSVTRPAACDRWIMYAGERGLLHPSLLFL